MRLVGCSGACLAEFLLRRRPPMRVTAVKRGSHDFSCLVVVDLCIRATTLRSSKAGAFVRLDQGFRPNPAKQALSPTARDVDRLMRRPGVPGSQRSLTCQ